ncbi:MAG: hypothetical protein ABI240_09450 [Sphingomonas sp.]
MSRLLIAVKALLLCCTVTAMPVSGDVPPPSPSDLVDLFIGTGGELRFVMQATPNKSWTTAEAARPFSMTGYSAAQ